MANQSAQTRQVIKELKAMADPERAEKTKRYFKTGKGEYGEGDAFIGIRMPVLRAHAKKNKDIPLVVQVELLRSELHEVRQFALICMVQAMAARGQSEAVQKDIFTAYMAHLDFVNNWDLVDSSAHHIVGRWLWENAKERALLKQLCTADNLWHRRVAMIATFYFIRKESFTIALDVAKRLLKDEEDLLHKAVGWMLREIGERDQGVEEAFLQKHYKKMPRTMLRYAIERFDEDLRQRYLRGEI